MGANSKVRRDAKKKREAAQRRRKQTVTYDMQDTLRLWYALGAGEITGEEQQAVCVAMILHYLKHNNPDHGLEDAKMGEIIEMSSDLIRDGLLTRLDDGTVVLGTPGDPEISIF